MAAEIAPFESWSVSGRVVTFRCVCCVEIEIFSTSNVCSIRLSNCVPMYLDTECEDVWMICVRQITHDYTLQQLLTPSVTDNFHLHASTGKICVAQFHLTLAQNIHTEDKTEAQSTHLSTIVDASGLEAE